jgi:predicted phage terminase large subunit-like protein
MPTAERDYLIDARLEKAKREQNKRKREAHWHDIDTPAKFAHYISKGKWRHARHLDLLSDLLVKVANGEITRLIVSMPPRHGKSELISKFFPTWYLMKYPDRRIMLASYESGFAASWGRKARDIMEEFGQPLAGITIDPASSAAFQWDIQGRDGGMTTAGFGGSLVGKGANVLIVDDPIKNNLVVRSKLQKDQQMEWYKSTAYPRLESDFEGHEGAIVIVMTRWYEDDLAGRLIEEMTTSEGENWTVLNLPAIWESEEADVLGRSAGEALWPERWPIQRLQRIKSTLGAFWWNAEYQQNPLPAGGLIFTPEMIIYEEPPDLVAGPGILSPYKVIIQAWDTAQKTNELNDYSACTTAAITRDNKVFILSFYMARLTTPQLLIQMKNQALKYGPDIIVIEDASSGPATYQLLKQETTLPVTLLKAEVDKVTRAWLVTPFLSQDRVRFVKGTQMMELEKQLLGFPNAEHDDAVDSFVYALMRAFNVEQRRKKEARSYDGFSADGEDRAKRADHYGNVRTRKEIDDEERERDNWQKMFELPKQYQE